MAAALILLTNRKYRNEWIVVENYYRERNTSNRIHWSSETAGMLFDSAD